MLLLIAAAVDRAGDAAAGAELAGGAPGRNRCSRRCARRSGIAPTCCWCSASSPAASSSPSSPCICRPIWSIAGSAPRSAAGPSRPSGCSTSSARSVGLARRAACRSAICSSIIYFARALSIVAFILLPATPVTTLIFGAVTGLLWLSTVPPTSGLVALMFGTRWLTMLFGFAFFSHQVGGFLGVWLGGFAVRAHRLLRRGVVACRCCSACCRPSSICRSSKSRWRAAAAAAGCSRRKGAETRRRAWMTSTPASQALLAHAGRHPALRLPDRDGQLRPALESSAFS